MFLHGIIFTCASPFHTFYKLKSQTEIESHLNLYFFNKSISSVLLYTSYCIKSGSIQCLVIPYSDPKIN